MSIADAIRERKLKQLNASDNFTTIRDKRVALAAQTLKHARLNDELDGEGVKPAEVLRRHYYNMCEQYTGKKIFSYDDPSNEKSRKLWDRVAKRCEESGASEVEYMKAQFDYFHATFKKAPTLSQLTTEAAVGRAKAFIGRSTERRIVSGATEVTLDFATMMRQSEQMMQQLMKAQDMTREEVYKNLVIPGIYSFPKEYLKADPAYKRALEEGE